MNKLNKLINRERVMKTEKIKNNRKRDNVGRGDK